MLALRLLSVALAPARRRLVRALPPELLRWLLGLLTAFLRWTDSVRRRTPSRLLLPTQPLGGGRLRVRHRGATLTAAVVSATSPVGARAGNLARVREILEAADIPYFRVPHARDQRTTLAVPAGCRERVIAALTSSPLTGDAEIRGWVEEPRRRRAALRDATIVEAYWPVTNVDRTLLLAETVACDVEFWTEDGDALLSPRRPPVTPPVRRDSPVVHAAERDFDQFCPALDDGTRFPTRRELMLAGMDWVRFPIDAVYTWVDGRDASWQQRKTAALANNGWATACPQTVNASRFMCRDELRYSLRSLHYYAPWIRRIFLVTDAQVPSWLDPDQPGVTVVDHRELFGAAGRLPTFNSHAIETRLHHIPGLAEHFLYLNDDVFFGRPQTPDQFFLPNGIARFFLSGLTVNAGPPLPEDPPVMSAAKNNRTVIAEHFGRLLTQKTQHTPHPQRRSVLTEIEQRCAKRLRATSDHQFRHPEDVSLPSSLQHYWSYLTGRAVPGRLSYMYTDVDDPMTPLLLRRLLRHRGRDVFCVNDTGADETAQERHAAVLAEFLPSYFPFPAPYELPVGVPRPAPQPERAGAPQPATVAVSAAAPHQASASEAAAARDAAARDAAVARQAAARQAAARDAAGQRESTTAREAVGPREGSAAPGQQPASTPVP